MQCQDCFYSSKIKLSTSRRDLTSNDNSNMHQYESRCSRNWIHPVINCTYTYSTSISIYGPNRFLDYIWLCTLITISFIRKFNKEATAKLTSYILSTRPACNRQGRKNLIKQISLSSRPIQMTSLSGGSIDEKSQTPKKWLNWRNSALRKQSRRANRWSGEAAGGSGCQPCHFLECAKPWVFVFVMKKSWIQKYLPNLRHILQHILVFTCNHLDVVYMWMKVGQYEIKCKTTLTKQCPDLRSLPNVTQ